MVRPASWLLSTLATALTWCGCSSSTPSVPTTASLDPFTAAQRRQAPAAALPCVSCHLADGMGRPDGAIPRLAGRHAAILTRKLERIADGTARLPVMSAYARALTAGDRHRVAAWFAHLPISEPVGQEDPVLRERGGQLYSRFCAGCHGPGGQGNVALDAPQLCRQHAGYLTRRLAEIAVNRRGDAAPAMVPIAARLTTLDRRAIASWLAASPCPEHAR